MGTVTWAAHTRPYPGLRENGDTFVVDEREGIWFAAIIDGLGHGADASRAAQVAGDALRRDWERGADAVLPLCHDKLRQTRGAVVGAVWADLGAGKLTYVGVGNIEGAIYGQARTQRLTSLGGFLGGSVALRVRGFHYTFGPGDILVMHSDGVSARFDPAAYPGLLTSSPDLIAQVLLRDWGRASDDATVLVARYEEGT